MKTDFTARVSPSVFSMVETVACGLRDVDFLIYGNGRMLKFGKIRNSDVPWFD